MAENNEEKRYLMRRVVLIIIASYFTFQIIISVAVMNIEGVTLFVKLMMVLQSLVPAFAVLIWTNSAGLFVPGIITLKFDNRLTNFLLVILFSAGFFMLTEGLGNLILYLLPDHIFQDMSEQLYRPSYNILLIRSYPDLLIVGLGIAILIPFLEELVFRGLALGVFRKAVGINQASLFSAVIWAFLHMNPVDFLSMMLMGIILAYITYRTGSLWLPIIVHIIFSLTELIYLNTFEYSRLMDISAWNISLLLVVGGTMMVFLGIQLLDRTYVINKSGI